MKGRLHNSVQRIISNLTNVSPKILYIWFNCTMWLHITSIHTVQHGASFRGKQSHDWLLLNSGSTSTFIIEEKLLRGQYVLLTNINVSSEAFLIVRAFQWRQVVLEIAKYCESDYETLQKICWPLRDCWQVLCVSIFQIQNRKYISQNY